jgi:hypothetical protein
MHSPRPNVSGGRGMVAATVVVVVVVVVAAQEAVSWHLLAR